MSNWYMGKGPYNILMWYMGTLPLSQVNDGRPTPKVSNISWRQLLWVNFILNAWIVYSRIQCKIHNNSVIMYNTISRSHEDTFRN